MPNIPLLKNNIVENIIVAEFTDDVPEGYGFGPDAEQVGIGWIFDGEKYVDPNPPPKQEKIVVSSNNKSGQIA